MFSSVVESDVNLNLAQHQVLNTLTKKMIFETMKNVYYKQLIKFC